MISNIKTQCFSGHTSVLAVSGFAQREMRHRDEKDPLLLKNDPSLPSSGEQRSGVLSLPSAD